MNKNFSNNGAANNNNNSINGGFTMVNGTMDMMNFADVVKMAMEERYGEGYSVDITTVTKNNDCKYVALVIKDATTNISPSIYLENAYEQYKAGRCLHDILDDIADVYETHKVAGDFDVSGIIDFAMAKDNICLKLVSASRNTELLSGVPHKNVLDMAMIFYIIVGHGMEGLATVTVRNELMDTWGITVDELYDIALYNTERKCKGVVKSMSAIMTEILADRMDEEAASEFYDLYIGENDIPMYVVTNEDKLNGAITVFYTGLLKKVAERLDSNLYILPSSIHEAILVPVSVDMPVDYLRSMVVEVNSSEVADNEILSDSVYLYDRDSDQIVLA